MWSVNDHISAKMWNSSVMFEARHQLLIGLKYTQLMDQGIVDLQHILNKYFVQNFFSKPCLEIAFV